MRNVILSVMLLFTLTTFGQITYTSSDYNVVDNLKYVVVDTDKDSVIGTKSNNEANAHEKLSLYQRNNPDANAVIRVIGEIRIDVSDRFFENPVQPTPPPAVTVEIDTIVGEILGQLDSTNASAVHIDYSNAGMEPSLPQHYVSLKGLKLFMPMITDTIEPWLRYVELERTKTLGETTLRRIGTPFQHKNTWVSERGYNHTLNAELTEYAQSYWVFIRQDNQEIVYSQMEFSFKYAAHGHKVTDLDFGETYKMWNFSINAEGEQIKSDMIEYTVDEYVASTDYGFRIYTAWPTQITSTTAKVNTWNTGGSTSIQLKLGTMPYELVEYVTDSAISSSNPYPEISQHGRVLENLLPDTRYYWEATLTLASGAKQVTSIHSFKTLP